MLFVRFIGLDKRMATIEEYQYERLQIARHLLITDSLARVRHDSIETYEGAGRALDAQIRTAQIKELREKGYLIK